MLSISGSKFVLLTSCERLVGIDMASVEGIVRKVI
jgi:hypothetical protein